MSTTPTMPIDIKPTPMDVLCDGNMAESSWKQRVTSVHFQSDIKRKSETTFHIILCKV
jgi:hypothetical protein